VRTNAGFQVTFSSVNNGKLKTTAVGGTATVPYLFYSNGVLLNLSNSNAVPVTGLSAAGQTGLSGLAYPLKVIIDSMAGGISQGGPYEDTVTISASTTE